jgi:SHAQKYF class myb-like DNA-binding protein
MTSRAIAGSPNFLDSTTLEPIYRPRGPPSDTFRLFNPFLKLETDVEMSSQSPKEDADELNFNIALSPIQDDHVAGPTKERYSLPSLSPLSFSRSPTSEAGETVERRPSQPTIRQHNSPPKTHLRLHIPESKSFINNSTTTPSQPNQLNVPMVIGGMAGNLDFINSGWVFHEHAKKTQTMSPSRLEKVQVRASAPKKRPYDKGQKPKRSPDSDDEEGGPTKYNHGVWSKEEHENFLRGLNECGHCWKKIATEYVKTRDRSQIASHAQKVSTYFHYI